MARLVNVFSSRTLFVVASIMVLAATYGCRPDWPECRNSQDCLDADENEGLYLYCANTKCEMCTDDGHCKPGFICKDYRCVEKPQCYTDADCTNNLVCRNQKCVPECTADADCPPNNRCQNTRCVPSVECTTDADCPAGQACQNNHCIPQVGAPPCTLSTIYFDFDKYNIRSDATPTLREDATCMKKRPNIKVSIEGHCDERGTTEYNLALGERRANAARKYLKDLGIDNNRLRTVSYGEERPADDGHTEDAWAKNRRSEFVISE